MARELFFPPNHHPKPTMKSIAKLILIITPLALGFLTSSCSSVHTGSVPEQLATKAGFKPITPTTPAQKQLLNSLPADKVSSTKHAGKTYYVLPEPANNRALVGGPNQYQRYQELLTAGKMSEENIQGEIIAQATEGNDWGTWGGWSSDPGIDW